MNFLDIINRLTCCLLCLLFHSFGTGQHGENANLIYHYSDIGSTWSTAINGEVAYVGSPSRGLHVLDISTITNPVLIDSFNTTGGGYHDIFLKDTILYIANSYGGLQILSCSNPSDITEISHLEGFSAANDINVQEDFVYIADYWSGLRIVDVSTPTSPNHVGFIPIQGRNRNLDANSAFTFIANSEDGGLHIIDITDPNNPFETSSFYVSQAYDVSIYSNYAYIASNMYGVKIVDISNASNPNIIGNIDTPNDAKRIIVHDDLAYVSCGVNGLYVYDISDPLNPTQFGYYYTGGYIQEVNVDGSIAFATDSYNGFYIIDFNKQLTAKFDADITHGLAPLAVHFTDNSWATDTTEILSWEWDFDNDGIIDSYNQNPDWLFTEPGTYSVSLTISDGSRDTTLLKDNYISVISPEFENTTLVGSLLTSGNTQDITVINNFAYLASGYEGLKIIDISNPSIPSEITIFLPDYGSVTSVAVNDTLAYITVTPNKIGIISINDPTNPVELTSFYIPGFSIQNILIRDNYAYISNGYTGFYVLDISEPNNPFVVGYYNSPGEVYEVQLIGDIAYLASGLAGLRILDISDPTLPSEIGFFDTDGSALGVTIDGNNIYISDSENGIIILNVSDPSVPVLINHFETEGIVQGIVLSGNLAFVANHFRGLRVLDVSNIYNFFEIGFYESIGTTIQLDYVDSLAYVANGNYGLQIIQFDYPLSSANNYSDIPMEFSLYQNYPNPFNPVTTISYQLPKSAFVNLSIYNVAGQLVETLVSGQKNAGNHSVFWNASGVGAGLYFYRIESGEYTVQNKCVILK